MLNRKLILAIFILFPLTTTAGETGKNSMKKGTSTTAFVHFNFLEAPNYKLYFKNNGNIQDPSGNWSMEFPKNSGKYPLFASGFAVSGYVDGQLRTSWMASASRIEEWQPGNIVDGTPANPSDSKFKVYRYTLGDVAVTNPDVANWPIDLGAEFNDNNNNGIYEPNLGEFPKTFGSQMVWYVINDGVPSSAATRLAGSQPMGLETQVSGFFFSGKGASLDNTAFIVYKLINKSSKTIENMVFSLWSDPDLGDAQDDLVGVDSLRSLAYCYNETNTDRVYGSAPPAFGYDFFLGPKVYTGNDQDKVEILGKTYSGYKSLGMSSFVKYVRGRVDLPDPLSIDAARNYQEGLKFDGKPFNPLTDGVGGLPSDNSRIVHPGSPEFSQGWRDALGDDRRMMINTQKFMMSPGDTQIVIVGYIVGQGLDFKGSIGNLRSISDDSQNAYNDLINIVPEKPKLGTLSVLVKNQNGIPAKNTSIAISSTGLQPIGKTFFNFEEGPFSTVLYEGLYDLNVIGFDEVWGRIPDTVKKTVSISEDGLTSLAVKVKETAGYEDHFDGKYKQYWKIGEKGDTAFTPNTYTNWSVINGYLGWAGNITYRGTYSAKVSLDLNGYAYPYVSFKANYRLNGIGDTLFVEGSGNNGASWVKLDSYQLEYPNQWLQKGFGLPGNFQITDSVKIRFRVVKRSGSPVTVKIDDFKVGHSGFTSIGNEEQIQNKFTLLPAYPNPFNPSTTIRWIQPGNGSATIRVMNLLGQEVKVISAGARISGENEQTVSFNGLTSGIYFYRIDLNGKSSSTGKLMLLK